MRPERWKTLETTLVSFQTDQNCAENLKNKKNGIFPTIHRNILSGHRNIPSGHRNILSVTGIFLHQNILSDDGIFFPVTEYSSGDGIYRRNILFPFGYCSGSETGSNRFGSDHPDLTGRRLSSSLRARVARGSHGRRVAITESARVERVASSGVRLRRNFHQNFRLDLRNLMVSSKLDFDQV